MSDSDPASSPPSATEAGASASPPQPAAGRRSVIAALAGAGALVLALVVYLVFFRQTRGLYGQILIDGKPAGGVSVELRVVSAEGEAHPASPTSDANGFFTLSLAKGSYRLESTLENKRFIRVGGEELEMILAGENPLSRLFEVGEELLPIPALSIAHPGEVIGPLDGDKVSPDARLRWKPYPNATKYMIQLTFLPTPSKSAVGSIFLSSETTAWGFSFVDEMGRPTELGAFTQLEPNHPERAFLPGARYSWRLSVFEGTTVKDTAGPFAFSVEAGKAAEALVARASEPDSKELGESKGALTGLVVEGNDVVREATFHLTLERQVPGTGRRETIPNVPVHTDGDGRYSLELPVGLYRILTADVRHGDTLYGRVGRQEVVLVPPASSSAIFDVQAGQYAQVPDIHLNKRFKIVFPTPGVVVSSAPTVSWEQYPRANRYQLTLTYIDENNRPSNVYVKLISTESVTLDDVSVSEKFAKKYKHPAHGLKPGGRYRIHVIAYEEPKRKREWDLTQPPPPWIRLSESETVSFRVEP